jgi:hypothetical protein
MTGALAPPLRPAPMFRAPGQRKLSLEGAPGLARSPAVNDGRAGADRAYAREATSSYRGFWDWSRYHPKRDQVQRSVRIREPDVTIASACARTGCGNGAQCQLSPR